MRKAVVTIIALLLFSSFILGALYLDNNSVGDNCKPFRYEHYNCLWCGGAYGGPTCNFNEYLPLISDGK